MADRPGTFTDFHFDSGAFDEIEMYLTWEVAPESGFIFPAFNFSFEVDVHGRAGGYIGLQLVGNARKAIFSIWDLPDQSQTALAMTFQGTRFGGEGEGAKCLIDFNWQLGREYRLGVRKSAVDSEGAIWDGAVQDTVTSETTVIGRILVKNSSSFAGYGKLRPSASVFVEYFRGPETCDSQPHSRVLWRGPFANGLIASKANVAHYSQCVHNNVTSSGKSFVTHETGGMTVLATPAYSRLW